MHSSLERGLVMIATKGLWILSFDIPQNYSLGCLVDDLWARTDNEEKDEKRSQNDKTGHGMEKRGKDKVRKGLKRQKEAKTSQKPTKNERDKKRVKKQPKIKAVSTRHRTKAGQRGRNNVKSRTNVDKYFVKGVIVAQY
ncbi:hypothetical protein Tco_1351443 [Tanacetum coccineum]